MAENIKDLPRRFYEEVFNQGAIDRVDPMIADGAMVAVFGTFAGTHEGEFMGVPASGKRFEIDSVDFVRIEDGKAAEHWGVTDVMGLMQQVGAIPSPA